MSGKKRKVADIRDHFKKQKVTEEATQPPPLSDIGGVAGSQQQVTEEPQPCCSNEEDSRLQKRTRSSRMAESKLSRKTFQYSVNGNNPCTLSSDNSSDVLSALLTDRDFKKIYDLKSKAGMDVLIQRKKPNSPAISVHFPCCLLENDEVLVIGFIKCDHLQTTTKPGAKTKKGDQDLRLGPEPEDLVILLVSTTGKKGIQNVIMKNPKLRKAVHYVCVVAVKGETVKQALRRDGRFAKRLFTMDFALEDDEKTITKMKNWVDELKDHKLYSIVRNSPEVMPDSLEMPNDFDDDQSESNPKEDMADSPHSRISDGESSGKDLLTSGDKEVTTTSKSKRTNKMEILGNIPDTKNILELLRSQYDSLVQHLKAREGIKTTAQVQEVLREEFSKETQGFSEIKTLKTLMERSASVCQVRCNDQGRGTGFLLFGRFILTNAHVITDESKNLLPNLTVSFNFEDLSKENEKRFALKREPIAYEYVYTQQHSVDFALLELEKSPEVVPLLQHYSAAPVRGGVCIIGHPDSGVQKMDTCLIIERRNQKQAAHKHEIRNPAFYQVIKEAYFNKKQELDGSQIEYDSCFFYGSSGSPVFDEHCNVIGIHTGGHVYKTTKPIGSILEYALPLLPILVSILKQTEGKHKHVWESFRAEKNTRLVIQYAKLTGNCAWERNLNVEEEEEDMDLV